jgi:DNA-binding NarL/FixJ family response regulator
MGTAVLVDQYPLWLEAVEVVARRVGLECVGKTTRSSDALRLIEEHECDMLVTGIQMPPGEFDGLQLIQRACQRVPKLKAIVLSMYDSPDRVDAAFAAGAVAYVVKTAHPEDLAAAIRQAFEHSIYIVGMRQQAVAQSVRIGEASSEPGLTRREIEILKLVAEGNSNAAVAKMLWVTEQTVKFHLSNIYRKLGVSNRTEASRWAQLHDLLVPVPLASEA